MADNPFDQFDDQAKANPFDAFDKKPEAAPAPVQATAPAPVVAPPTAPAQPEEVGTVDYLINSLKKGAISSAAALKALLDAGYTRMAAADLVRKGTVSPDVTMRQAYGMNQPYKPVVQDVAAAFAEQQRRLSPLTGAQVDMRAPGPVSEVVGAGLEAVTDPLSYTGLGLPRSVIGRQILRQAAPKVVRRTGSEFATGAVSDVGSKLGAEAEKSLTGEDTGIGRLIGGVGAGVGTASVREAGLDVLSNTIDQFARNRKLLQATPEVSNMFAKGAAKNLLELAAKEEGAQSVEALIALVNDASQFVNKSDAPLVIAMADNPIIRQQVERLAKTNPVFRQKVNDIVSQASQDIVSKTTRMFGERYGATVPEGAGLKVAPVVARRKADIDRELDDVAERFTPDMDQEQLGSKIEGLIEEKKKAARAEVSPDYERLLDEARSQRVKMPEDGVGDIYDFVVQNNMRDIFGKTSQIDKDIMRHLEPKPVTKPNPKFGEEGELPTITVLEHTPMSFDNVESLKKAINRIKREKLSDEQARKISQLEQVVDQARETIPGNFSNRLNDIDLKYYEKVGVPFGEQGIKDIDSKKYATQVAPIIVKNPESYNQFIRAVGKEKGDVLAENAIIAEVYQRAVKDGRLNPKSLAKYLKDKAGVISQIDGLEDRLKGALLDDTQLQNRMRSLDDAAKVAQDRVAKNALTQFDVPDYATLTSNVINNPKMREKIMRDISDLDPDTAKAVRNALRVEAINLGRNNAKGFMDYVMNPANKAGIEAIFGQSFQPALRKLALFSDKVSKADVTKLTSALDKGDLDALQRVLPGINIPYLTSTLRDRISSVPHKVIRLISKYNSSQLATATDDAIMELLLDPNGVQKLANVATTLKFDVSNPASLGKIADSLSRTVPRSFYTSSKTAISGEERARMQKEAKAKEADEMVTGGFDEEPAAAPTSAAKPETAPAPAAPPPAAPVTTASSAKPYSYESLSRPQLAKMSAYMDSLGLNKEFLMNASTFNSTPIEKRKKLFGAIGNMAAGGPVYTPEEQRLLMRYASR